MLHSAEGLRGMRTNRTINNGMGGSVVSRADTMKHYKKSEKKWRKDLKALKNQSKIIYSISNKYGLRCEIKNIKKIWAKDSKKFRHYSSGSSSDYLYSNYYSAINSR